MLQRRAESTQWLLPSVQRRRTASNDCSSPPVVPAPEGTTTPRGSLSAHTNLTPTRLAAHRPGPCVKMPLHHNQIVKERQSEPLPYWRGAPVPLSVRQGRGSPGSGAHPMSNCLYSLHFMVSAIRQYNDPPVSCQTPPLQSLPKAQPRCLGLRNSNNFNMLRNSGPAGTLLPSATSGSLSPTPK